MTSSSAATENNSAKCSRKRCACACHTQSQSLAGGSRCTLRPGPSAQVCQNVQLRHLRASAATAEFERAAAAAAADTAEDTAAAGSQASVRSRCTQLVAAVSGILGHARNGSATRGRDTTLRHYLAPPAVIHWALRSGLPRSNLSELYTPGMWDVVARASVALLGWNAVMRWAAGIAESHREGEGLGFPAVLLAVPNTLFSCIQLRHLEEIDLDRFRDDARDYAAGIMCCDGITKGEALLARERVVLTRQTLCDAAASRPTDSDLQRLRTLFEDICCALPIDTWAESQGGDEESLRQPLPVGDVWWRNGAAAAVLVTDDEPRCTRCTRHGASTAATTARPPPTPPSLAAVHVCEACTGSIARSLCGIFVFVTIYARVGESWRLLAFEMPSNWGLAFDGPHPHVTSSLCVVHRIHRDAGLYSQTTAPCCPSSHHARFCDSDAPHISLATQVRAGTLL